MLFLLNSDLARLWNHGRNDPLQITKGQNDYLFAVMSQAKITTTRPRHIRGWFIGSVFLSPEKDNLPQVEAD